MDLMLLTKQGGILLPFAAIEGYLLEAIVWFLGLFSEYPSMGVAIILFTIVIYVAMIPLTVKQQKFSKLNAKMNPEIQAIQEKYKGKSDQESLTKMNQETQSVYAKYGVSPSGSCLQLLIQMPILFALYRVIYNMPAYVGRMKEVFFPLVTNMTKVEGMLDFIQGTSTVGEKEVNNISSITTFSKQLGAVPDLLQNGSAESITTVENTYIDVLNRASTTDWNNLKKYFDSFGSGIVDTVSNVSYADLSAQVTETVSKLEKFNSFLGLNIANSPQSVITMQMANATDERNYLMIFGVLLIPILSAVTQWINTKLMPQQENTKSSRSSEQDSMMQSMKMMNNVMPLMSAFFCFSLPIGMGIYWISGSVVRSVIQICVNKHLDKIDIDEMIKKNIEKNNEKRRKQGLPPQKITTNATINTRNVGNKTESSKEEGGKKTAGDRAKVNESVKASTDYYNSNSDKPGSLASKAAMVKKYNEKNNQ